jgi:hypothetical protein
MHAARYLSNISENIDIFDWEPTCLISSAAFFAHAEANDRVLLLLLDTTIVAVTESDGRPGKLLGYPLMVEEGRPLMGEEGRPLMGEEGIPLMGEEGHGSVGNWPRCTFRTSCPSALLLIEIAATTSRRGPVKTFIVGLR